MSLPDVSLPPVAHNSDMPTGDASSAEAVPAGDGSSQPLTTVSMDQLSGVNIDQIVVKPCLDANNPVSTTSTSTSTSSEPLSSETTVTAVPLSAIDNDALLQQAIVQPSSSSTPGVFVLKTETCEISGM